MVSPAWDSFLQECREKLCNVKGNRRNILNQLDVLNLNVLLKMLQGMIGTFERIIKGLDEYSRQKLEKQIIFLIDVLKSRGRYLSTHEVNDINLEVDRFYCLAQLCQIESNREYKNHCNNPEVQRYYDTARGSIQSFKQFSENDKKLFERCLTELKKILRINYMNLDRMEVLKAMKHKQGRWYKCPNGHLYVITECGRPVSTSSCNECGERIGGTNKTLLPNNTAVRRVNHN